MVMMSDLPSRGIFALVGGNEFRPDCELMDRELLTRLGRKPKVVILPTAAAPENPALAAENGVRYFQRLGAEATAAMIIDRETAQEPFKVNQVREADFLYFTGGDPWILLTALRGSPAWEAAKGVWQRGGLLAGSSAGAMILGGWMWAPGRGWEEGLGLVPGLAILPHHAGLARSWDASRMKATLPKGMVLVGIDEATALVGPPWEVIGEGEVAVYFDDRPSIFKSGQAVLLESKKTHSA